SVLSYNTYVAIVKLTNIRIITATGLGNSRFVADTILSHICFTKPSSRLINCTYVTFPFLFNFSDVITINIRYWYDPNPLNSASTSLNDFRLVSVSSLNNFCRVVYIRLFYCRAVTITYLNDFCFLIGAMLIDIGIVTVSSLNIQSFVASTKQSGKLVNN